MTITKENATPFMKALKTLSKNWKNFEAKYVIDGISVGAKKNPIPHNPDYVYKINLRFGFFIADIDSFDDLVNYDTSHSLLIIDRNNAIHLFPDHLELREVGEDACLRIDYIF